MSGASELNQSPTNKEVVMAINVGDAVPDIEVRVPDEGGMPTSVQTGDVLGTGKVVLFAVPVFYNRLHHGSPPYIRRGASDLVGEGVDTIACIAVNDAWVMGAWGQAHGLTTLRCWLTVTENSPLWD